MSEPADILAPLAYNFAKRRGVLLASGDKPRLIMRSGAGFDALLEARRVIGRSLDVETVTPTEFERALAQVYAGNDLSSSAQDATENSEDLAALADNLPRSEDLLDSADDAPVIRLINGILQEALRRRASDVHIQPQADNVSVRLRVDGALQEILSLPARLSGLIASRVKVMAQLDIARKRTPQDGRFSFTLGQQSVDVRVSTLPSSFGERVVMRILEKDESLLRLGDLGLGNQNLTRFREGIVRPNGIILVTGPTGSGKTTTLYAALSELNDGSRNILTVEDPVEYALDGIGQTQVNNKVGMTFASGLRAILRQDPDVVMVGEIRDPETAEIAVQASLTGHLVLSTVHTNSAIAAVTRLRDMKIEPFLLSSTVTAIMAQRLVRRLCSLCKAPYTPDATELRRLGISGETGLTFYKAVGCEACHQTGFEGRLGLYELVIVDEQLKTLIHDGAAEKALTDHAFRNSATLLEHGAMRVKAGETSAPEVMRVCLTHSAEEV